MAVKSQSTNKKYSMTKIMQLRKRMLRKMESKSLFTKKDVSGHISTSQLQGQKELPSKPLYHRLSDLPLNIFIDCLCDKNYSIVGGQEAWNKLYMEYVDLMKDKQQLFVIKTQYDIVALSYKINSIHYCEEMFHNFGMLENGFEKEKLEIANLVSKITEIKISNFNSRQDLISVKLKKWIIELETKKKELERATNTSDNHPVTHSDFDTLITHVSKHMQFHVNKFEIMTSEFVHMYLNLKNTQEILKNSYGGKRTH